MNYRKDKYGNEISVLGYGCMRFTQKLGKIDLAKAEEEILEAFHAGVNYYDTAYIYPGSEAALGEILSRNNIRDQVNIATKLPHYLTHSVNSVERCFQEELRRLKTDHVDYYLMHMLTDDKTWEKMCQMGIREWIAEKKASGAIRQVGFSYHGNTDTFCKLIDAYDWDFCQIQYNYLDEHTQAGRTGLDYAAERGIPVIIMEPLRGGRLANQLPKASLEEIDAYPVKRSPAEWAFRWLWNQPEVTCVLSGMNSMAMVRENVRIASEARVGEIGEAEEALYGRIVDHIHATMKVGCTGCRYCMPCPKGVDIPGTFAAYNRTASDGKMRGKFDYLMSTGMRRTSSGVTACVGCGKCEQHCPQHIEIRKELKEAGKVLEGPIYKTVRGALSLFKAY